MATMATLFRNRNVRLSLIADAFSRLHLQRSSFSPPTRHSFQLRSITLHPDLLRSEPGSDPTTSQCDHSSPSDDSTPSSTTRLPLLPTQTVETKKKTRMTHRSRRWTDEEDRELFRLVMKDISPYDIYAKYFPYRSFSSVSRRIGFASKVVRTLEQQGKSGVREGGGEVEDGGSAAGVDKTTKPLRIAYLELMRSIAAKRSSDNSDNAILKREKYRRSNSRKGGWSLEEDALLEQLMKKYRHLPEPAMWNAIAGGSVDESSPPLLRGVTSCIHRWRRLHLPPSGETGRWTKEEELRLQEAIWEQFEGKYQVVVDVLIGKPAATENTLGKWRPELQQLPSQAGLPILKWGSRRLRLLDWNVIADKVRSRHGQRCRIHFYDVYNNANRGPWSDEEVGRLKEGLEMFGKDYGKIAEHVGTRSLNQVTSLVFVQERKKEKRKKALEDKMKPAAPNP